MKAAGTLVRVATLLRMCGSDEYVLYGPHHRRLKSKTLKRFIDGVLRNDRKRWQFLSVRGWFCGTSCIAEELHDSVLLKSQNDFDLSTYSTFPHYTWNGLNEMYPRCRWSSDTELTAWPSNVFLLSALRICAAASYTAASNAWDTAGGLPMTTAVSNETTADATK